LAGDALSVLAAAAQVGSAPALDVDRRTLTFEELAALVRARMRSLAAWPAGVPYPLVGTPDLDALVLFYALLETRVPALLVHPRLTPHERAEQAAAAERAGPLRVRDAVAIAFTSGTTGAPRGAVLTRDALLASAAASEANLGWLDDDRWLLCMPLAHVGGLSIVTRCLAARRCVVVAPRFDAAIFPRWVDERRATLASLVPTMLARILETNPNWRPPPHFRAILCGGADVPQRLRHAAKARGVPMLPSYGLTESCAAIVVVPYAERHDPAGWGSGRPLPGVDLRVVDGRIEVRGPMLMAGYWGEEPLAPGAWFDTGDLGGIDGRGCLHVRARRTDLIVSGGENVYPAEVERALEVIPGIAAAGVFGIPSATWGEEVVAVLVASSAPPQDSVLLDHFAARLAPHKRPRRVCYVSSLPHTPGGKLDREALRAFAPALRTLS
jgi:O-succinylbenzoic acid--CoA ligase